MLVYHWNMAMMLKPPPGGAWLAVDEVIARLRAEFARVEVVPGGTAEFASGVAKSYRQAGQAALAECVEAVRDKGTAVAVVEGDPKHALILMVIPEMPIMAGFGSEEHLQAIQPLLRQCVEVLGYDLNLK